MRKGDALLLIGHQVLLGFLGGDPCWCPTGEGLDKWVPSLLVGVGLPVVLIVAGALVSRRRGGGDEPVDGGD